MRKCDILLVVATELERNALLDVFGHQPSAVQHSRSQTYFELGEIGGAYVCAVKSEMGANSSGGAHQTVCEAILDREPRFVMMVGIAWGAQNDWKRSKPGGQEIGDILISKLLADFDEKRVGTDEAGEMLTVRRGIKVPGSELMLKRLQSFGWQGSNVHFGLLLSGPELIDNLEYRNTVLADFPEAIGGEMEGLGVYRACNEHATQWMIVKAICDWADGKKKDNKRAQQMTAARNAATFVYSAIQAGGFNPELFSSDKDSTEQPIPFAEPGEEERMEYESLLEERAESTPNRSIIETELELLRNENAFWFTDTTGESPKQSLSRMLHLSLLSGRSQIASDLKRIFPGPSTKNEIYVTRDIDLHFNNFLKQYQRNIFVFANKSGAGKSTFLSRTFYHLSHDGHLVFYVSGSQLELSEDQPEKLLATLLGSNYSPNHPASKFLYRRQDGTDVFDWSRLKAYAQLHRKEIFFVIDALDRATFVQQRLVSQFSLLLNQLPSDEHYPVRIVISCRSEVWESERVASLFFNKGSFFQHNTYYAEDLLEGMRMKVGSAPLESDWSAGWFTKPTYLEAFRKHQDCFQLPIDDEKRFADASFELLREPLLLRIFFESLRGAKDIPSESPSRWQLLLQYVIAKRTEIRYSINRQYPQLNNPCEFSIEVDELITSVVLFFSIEMYCGGTNSIDRAYLESRISAWLDLLVSNRGLNRVLDDVLPEPLTGAPGRSFFCWFDDCLEDRAQFISAVIDAALSVDLLAMETNRLRFTLDLYFEFCLGRAIGNAVLNQHTCPRNLLNSLLNYSQLDDEETDEPDIFEADFQENQAPKIRDLLPSQFLANALEFGILQIEQNARNAKQLTLVSDCLGFLATHSFLYQNLACEIVCNLETLAAAYQTDAWKPTGKWIWESTDRADVVRRLIGQIVERCLNPISNRGDFVCRFALRQAIIAIRTANSLLADDLLEDWLTIETTTAEDSGFAFDDGQEMNLSSTAELLRSVAYIDALGGSEQESDFYKLINCLQIPVGAENSEIRFWIRRMASVSTVQYVRSHMTRLADEQLRQVGTILEDAVNDSVSAFEEAMLSEQYIYFVHASQTRELNLILGCLLDSSKPWKAISVLFALININNQSVADVHNSLTDGHENIWRKSFLRFVENVVNHEPEIRGESCCFQLIFDRMFDGLKLILANPDRRITEQELYDNENRVAKETGLDATRVQIYFSPEFFSTYFDNHHECKERVYCLLDRFRTLNEHDSRFKGMFQFVEPDRLDAELLTRSDQKVGVPIHEENYVVQVRELSNLLESQNKARAESRHLQVNIRPGSWGAALRSAGSVFDAVSAALSNEHQLAFCLNRPPGHLATNQICIFNNVAVGVRSAQELIRKKTGKIPRITVLDIDAHHGLNLQQCFYSDERVAYVSIHQNNIHPGEGFVWQAGFDRRPLDVEYFGTGSTLNFPVPENAALDYCLEFTRFELREHLKLHQPEMIFVACGSDADFRDPFAQLKFEPQCFFEYGKTLKETKLPIVVAFEGGFGITNGGISDPFEAFLRGVVGEEALPERLAQKRPSSEPESHQPIAAVRSVVCTRRRSRLSKSKLRLHGDVRNVLDSRVTKTMLREFKLSNMEFGIGAGAVYSPDNGRDSGLDRVGETLVLAGTPFVQCPVTKAAATDSCLASPFYLGWRGIPDFWMHIRTWRPIELRELMDTVTRAFDVPCGTLGIVGAVRMADPADLKEKRLAISPSESNGQKWQDVRGEEYLILQKELISTYFDSGVEQASPFDSTMVLTGLIHRTGAQYTEDQLNDEQLKRSFYSSPREGGVKCQWQQHLHFGLLRDSQLDSLWTESPVLHQTFVDRLQKLSEQLVLVSHLESVNVREAFIGLQRIDV